LGALFLTDAAIFPLRSIEYALVLLPYPAHHHRNPLLGSPLATASARIEVGALKALAGAVTKESEHEDHQ